MKALFSNSHAITAFAQNVAYTATSGGPFIQSGLTVTPNTTNTNAITVDVEAGVINVESTNDQGETVRENVSLGAQSVTLSAVPGDPDTAVGRVDVIYATENGVDAVEGEVAPKRPTQAGPFNDDIEGDFPGVWSPAPNDGSLVPGVGRAIVYTTPQVSDSTDITGADIVNFDAQGTAANAIGRDELRPAIEDIDTDPDALQTTVQNSEGLGGQPHQHWARDFFSVSLPQNSQKIGANTTLQKNITLPPDHELALWRTSLQSDSGVIENDVSLSVVRSDPDTANIAVFSSSAEYEQKPGSALARTVGQSVTTQLFFRLNNPGDMTNEKYTAMFRAEMIPPPSP